MLLIVTTCETVRLEMGLQRKEVEGLDNFLALAESLKGDGKKVYALFTGNKDTSTGISWCPDCVKGSI